MSVQLKLSVDQISIAILLLDDHEREVLKKRLPALLELEPDELEDLGWLQLAQPAFSFWEDPEEDVYNDLIPERPHGADNAE